jgi:membrane-associated phospholipid phosphatase
MASFTFNLEGADSHSLSMNPAPAFSGSATAAEMVELYWMAICRDVPFADYSRSPLIRQAAQELSGLAAYPAARERGEISPNTIFRPAKSHCIAGPYISQLLLKPFPVSDNYLPQMWRFAMPGRDFMTQTASWLAVQNGSNADALPLEQSRRFIRNGRDLASYVHKDYSFQIFLHAALILLDSFPGAMLPTSPYRNVVQNQAGFSTFGGPFVCDLVAKAANAALKAAWFQKWLLHRRLRPEEMAGRVHFARSGAAQYPIHPSLLSSKAVDATFERHGSYLLPQAYPEGSPLHPSYPSGHGAVAGACATVLKALCHGEAIFASPVEPSPDGYTLNSHVGVPLTLGGEIDKLAYNVAFGRNWAGIHYWSDAIDGLLLGEQVAIHLLQDSLSCCQEATLPFAFTGFNGNQISIAKS